MCTPGQEGSWAKVGLVRRLLEEVPPARAQWLLFAQPDALIDDVAFAFPFDNYQDKDLVALGNATRLAAGDPGGAPQETHPKTHHPRTHPEVRPQMTRILNKRLVVQREVQGGGREPEGAGVSCAPLRCQNRPDWLYTARRRAHAARSTGHAVWLIVPILAPFVGQAWTWACSWCATAPGRAASWRSSRTRRARTRTLRHASSQQPCSRLISGCNRKVTFLTGPICSKSVDAHSFTAHPPGSLQVLWLPALAAKHSGTSKPANDILSRRLTPGNVFLCEQRLWYVALLGW